MPRSYSIGEFADELGVHPQTVKPGVATTISTTPEHPAVNVEFHTEHSAGSQATLAQQTVLHFTPAFRVTARVKTATLTADSQATLAQQTVLHSTPASQLTTRQKTPTSTANSTDSQNTLTTTDGASKTPIPTLELISTPLSMTDRKPTTDAFSSPASATNSPVCAHRKHNSSSIPSNQR